MAEIRYEGEIGSLYRVADAVLRRSLSGHPSEHSDLVQVVLERLVRSLREDRFAGRCSLTTWVAVIARGVAKDELRARARQARLSPVCLDTAAADLAAMHGPWVERQLEARSVLVEVRRALRGMDRRQAATLVLHDVHGYALGELATMMDVSEAAAQSRLVRGRRELRRRIQRRIGALGPTEERTPAR